MGSCHCKTSNDISSIKVIQYPSGTPEKHLNLAQQISKLNIPRTKPEKKTDAMDSSELKLEQGSFMQTKQKKITIEGQPSSTKQSAFQDKLTQIIGESTQLEVLQKLNMWVYCKKGLKPTQPNQDDFCIVVDGDDYLVGVFDGHGTYGHWVSDFVHKELPILFFEHPLWLDNPEKVMKDSFVKCHQNLIKMSCTAESTFDCNMSGSTATCVYKRDKSLFVAHVGDSRGILGRRTELGYVPIVLNIDHKPELLEEKLRIEKAGGEIRKLPGNNPSRVYFKGREYPGLSMTRAIGDLVSQSIGVICSPQTSELFLTPDDEFLILCSDGVWEFISDEEAIRVASNSGRNPKEAASRLAALAWTKWISNEGNVVDDITVVVAYFPDT